jgi:hypothetical protein
MIIWDQCLLLPAWDGHGIPTGSPPEPYNIDFVGKFVKKKMEDIVLSF